MPSSVDLAAAYAESGVADVQEQLDRELIGLTSVKTRIREIAALLLVDQARQQHARAVAWKGNGHSVAAAIRMPLGLFGMHPFSR